MNKDGMIGMPIRMFFVGDSWLEYNQLAPKCHGDGSVYEVSLAWLNDIGFERAKKEKRIKYNPYKTREDLKVGDVINIPFRVGLWEILEIRCT